jgi:hypothetical protein
MTAYFSGRLPPKGVRIELTEGEEIGGVGAKRVRRSLLPTDVVAVVDVTGTPTDKPVVIEKCGRRDMQRLVTLALGDLPHDLHAGCPDLIANLDESDIYRRRCPRCFFVGVPVSGGDYNREPVRADPAVISGVAEALIRLAWAVVEDHAGLWGTPFRTPRRQA